MDKVQFLMGLSIEMACFMDERGGQVALSMKSGCFMDGWGIEEGCPWKWLLSWTADVIGRGGIR